MEIKITTTNKLGEVEDIIYRDIDSETDFEGKKIKGCRAYSFHKDKFVLVYAKSKGYWTPPGGGVEKGESVIDAVRREVKEETNMNVIEQRFAGLIEVRGPGRVDYYTTSVCIVEPIGDFTEDPDGEITEIKCIDFADYKSYSDQRIGDIVDKQIERAVEILTHM